MVYTVIASNGQSYDLPAKTLAVKEKLDKALNVDSEKGLSLKQKYQKIFDFVKDLVGADNLKEIFGSTNINDIDLGELELMVLKISDSYNNSITEYQNERLRSAFDSIPADKIDALTNAMKTAK